MHSLTATFAVLFGLAFGSFLNVCIARLPQGESVIAPGSRCPRCKTPIRAFDNLPLASWLLLRGRCRDCGVAIPLRYPLVEAATAALFLLAYLELGLTLRSTGAAALCFLLVGLAAMDAETLLLPYAFTFPGIALGVLFSGIAGTGGGDGRWAATQHPHWAAAIFSAASALEAAALILLIRSIYWLMRHQEGMGLGDAKLMAMIAAWLGPMETLLVFFLAVVAAAVFGVGLVFSARIRGVDKSRTPTKVPFGAFLCIAAVLALFRGPEILKWYFSFFS